MVAFIISLFALTAQAEPTATAYRVIRASPHDFVSAIRSRTTQAARGPATSRMQKFFRIKSKMVEGPKVRLEILPEVPLLASYFPAASTVRIELIQRDLRRDVYRFDARLEAMGGQWLNADLQIEPVTEGSLLRLSFKDSSYSPRVTSWFMAAARSLGFVFPTPAEAERDVQKSTRQKPNQG